MKEFHVLNLGAGVQSTVLFLMAHLRASGQDAPIPLKIDVAIFADTQEEPADVYRHLDYLQSLKTPRIEIRTAGKLGDDLIRGQGPKRRFASIPAFTKGDGIELVKPGCGQRAQPTPTYGIVRRQCTSEYKIKVVDRFIRRELLGLARGRRIPADMMVHQYFGISVDERDRAHRALRRFKKLPQFRPQYPLLDMGWSRSRCQKWLDQMVPYPVPRSACVFCPYRSNAEWQRLKEHDPAAWARAVEIDEALRNGAAASRQLSSELYLHRTCLPLAEIDLKKQHTLFRPLLNECQGMCGN